MTTDDRLPFVPEGFISIAAASEILNHIVEHAEQALFDYGVGH